MQKQRRPIDVINDADDFFGLMIAGDNSNER